MTQTATGQVTMVTMALATGQQPPSVINLPDATSIFPAANGTISVDARWISALMRSGWQIQVSSGTTHVP